MDEIWEECSITDWDLDNVERKRKELKERGLEPVEPIDKKAIVERPAFLLRCKRIPEGG